MRSINFFFVIFIFLIVTCGTARATDQIVCPAIELEVVDEEGEALSDVKVEENWGDPAECAGLCLTTIHKEIKSTNAAGRVTFDSRSISLLSVEKRVGRSVQATLFGVHGAFS